MSARSLGWESLTSFLAHCFTKIYNGACKFQKHDEIRSTATPWDGMLAHCNYLPPSSLKDRSSILIFGCLFASERLWYAGWARKQLQFRSFFTNFEEFMWYQFINFFPKRHHEHPGQMLWTTHTPWGGCKKKLPISYSPFCFLESPR